MIRNRNRPAWWALCHLPGQGCGNKWLPQPASQPEDAAGPAAEFTWGGRGAARLYSRARMAATARPSQGAQCIRPPPAGKRGVAPRRGSRGAAEVQGGQREASPDGERGAAGGVGPAKRRGEGL